MSGVNEYGERSCRANTWSCFVVRPHHSHADLFLSTDTRNARTTTRDNILTLYSSANVQTCRLMALQYLNNIGYNYKELFNISIDSTGTYFRRDT